MKKNWMIAVSVALALVAAGILFALVSRRASAGGVSPKEKTSVERAVSAVSKDDFDVLFKQAAVEEEKGELLKAQEAFKNIIAVYASRSGVEEVQKRLEAVNMRVLCSAINVPNLTATYVVREGDVLSMIAEEHGTTVEFVKKQNGLSSDVIRPNMRLRIWTGKFNVLVDKSQNILMLKSDGEVVKTYRVSTGKGNITPVGTFKIINKLIRPSWTHEGKLIPYGDPNNILGTRWIGFDIPSYGIHGTTEPESIGQQATAGCVRMLNNEVEELYDLLPLNTEVVVMD